LLLAHVLWTVLLEQPDRSRASPSPRKVTQAVELFKAAGYTIDKTGGIKDGKLVVDK